jgi:hypothetical protein
VLLLRAYILTIAARQPVYHPLRTLLLARTRARTSNLLSCRYG